MEPGKQLGISIRGGSEHGLGIYITGVDDGSVADTYGLKVRIWLCLLKPCIDYVQTLLVLSVLLISILI